MKPDSEKDKESGDNFGSVDSLSLEIDGKIDAEDTGAETGQGLKLEVKESNENLKECLENKDLDKSPETMDLREQKEESNTTTVKKPTTIPQIKVNSFNMKESVVSNGNSGRKTSKTFAALQASKIYPAFMKSKEKKSKQSMDEDDSAIHNNISIWQAVRDNLHVELDFLLHRYSDPLQDKDNTGYTALHLACKYNRVLIIQVLLQHKAGIEVKGPYDVTPLHLASKHDSKDAIKLLLEYGANVMCKDCKQKTPLHYAVRRGHLDVCKMLLNCDKSDINVVDEDSLTALHEAVIHKQIHIVPLLLDRGIDIFKLDINDSMAFQYAACEDLLGILEDLYTTAFREGGSESQNMLVTHIDNEGNTALHMAVQNNKLKAAEFLLKKGSDVDKKNESHFTLLHIASMNGNLPLVELLLSHGSRLEIRDKDFMTPIHRAAMYNRYQVIEPLMKKGGDINAKSKDLMTPLLIACWKGHMETVEFLLANGGQLTETDIYMKTGIHWSVDTGHINVLSLLLKHGGVNLLECQDHIDQTALHYAARKGNLTILKILLDHKSVIDARDQDGKTPLHIAAEYNNDAIIDALIRVSQAELNDSDGDGGTPLMLASDKGNHSSVKALLAHGADITIRDENNCTALILASSEGHYKVMKTLIDNMADLKTADKLKNTALHMSSKNGHVDCVKLLLQNGASVKQKNLYGKTAMDLAIDFGHTDTVITFLRNSTWKESMEVRDKKGQTPMDSLIQKAPEAALVVMDNCVQQSTGRKDDIQFTVEYAYKYIDPGPDDPASKNDRYYALNAMLEYNREELLSHPLVQSLLLMKWRKFGRVAFYVNLALYFLFLLFHVIYTTLMPKITTTLLDNVRRCPIYLNSTQLSNQTVVDYYVENGQLSNVIIENPVVYGLQTTLFILILLFMLQQLSQLISTRWRYFLGIHNYLTLAMLIASIYFLNSPQAYPCEQEWRAGWISSLIAWILFMEYLKQFDSIGIYFVMFSEVLVSLLKVTLVLVLFLMSFSQAFSITMAQTTGFKSGDVYPLTVLSMTLGELNYLDNFDAEGNYPFNTDNNLLAMIFMIVMPIALMNLLIGVAVGDIEKIQQKSYITRLSLQIKHICSIETGFPKLVQRKVYQQTYTVKPNEEKNTKLYKIKKAVFGLKNEANSFIGEETNDLMKESMEKLKLEVSRQKYQLQNMSALLKQSQEMLKQIGEHFNVDYKLDTLSIAESVRPDSRMDLY